MRTILLLVFFFSICQAFGSVCTLAQVDPLTEHLLGPISQLGFAGAFVIAMSLLGWMIKTRRDDWQKWDSIREDTFKSWMSTLTDLQKQTNVVVEKNALASSMLAERISEFGARTAELHRAMLSRPCLMDKEAGGGR